MSTSPVKPTQSPFIQELAKEHGVSESAVETLYAALRRGGGSMAQFSHPELGGSGQWMKNGMIMVGDMFNDALKAKVDALCQALLPHLNESPSFSVSSPANRASSGSSMWWPADYGSPSATGGQNDFRYAYFPKSNALVVEHFGKTVTYDTTGHDFHGFGQQQSSSAGFSLQSSAGTVELSQLPLKVSTPGFR